MSNKIINKFDDLPPDFQTSYKRMVDEIGRLAAEAGDLNILYNAIVYGVQSVSDYHSVNLFIVDEDREWIALKATSDDPFRTTAQRRHKLAINNDSLISRVVHNRSIRVAIDKQEDNPVLFSSADLPLVHSELCAPLISPLQGNVIGVLDIQSKEYNAFQIEEAVMFDALAKHIAILLEK